VSRAGARFHLDNVSVAFNGKNALDSVSMVIESGEMVAFVGPSGAGKTSALRLLNGTIRPTTGVVRVNGEELSDLNSKSIKALRSKIGFVHQEHSLVPNLRVSQNVLAGRLGRTSFWRSLCTMIRPPRADLERVHELLDRVGIAEKLFERTDRLSGGQRQRVAIARALYQEGTALLVDEPVSSLDPARSRDTIDLLTSLARERGLTLVASMHDLSLAREFFPRLIGLRDGVVHFDRLAAEIVDTEFESLYQLDSEEMWGDGC
jgi:phosphonate transport system ATP-binding protein